MHYWRIIRSRHSGASDDNLTQSSRVEFGNSSHGPGICARSWLCGGIAGGTPARVIADGVTLERRRVDTDEILEMFVWFPQIGHSRFLEEITTFRHL